MNYKIIMMSGEKYSVNKSEYQAIMKADKGIFVPRLEVYINKSSISTAYPLEKADEIEDRKMQMTGVLHDGTKVKRHFGVWVDMQDSIPDDEGKYQPIKIDPEYYPEVAKDCVATEQEFEKVRSLPLEERKSIIFGLKGGKKPTQINKSQSIGELLDDKI